MKKFFIGMAVLVMTALPVLASTVVVVETSCGKTVVATSESNLTMEQAAVVAAVADYLYC